MVLVKEKQNGWNAWYFRIYFHGKESPSWRNLACFPKCMVSVGLENSATACFLAETHGLYLTVQVYQNGPSSVWMFWRTASASACNQSCSSAGKELLQRRGSGRRRFRCLRWWVLQLRLVGPEHREKEGAERRGGRGFQGGRMEKWTLKNKSRIWGGDLAKLFHWISG